MQKEIRRSIISGSVQAPQSAPMAHRALMLATLSPGQTAVSGLPASKGIDATISACRAFGADIMRSEGDADVFGPEEIIAPDILDCNGSNTTVKLMLPLCASLDSEVKISVSGSISKIDLSPFLDFLKASGASVFSSVSYPARVQGPISLEESLYSGGLGSQFLSGILLCAPLLSQEASIGLDGSLAGYSHVSGTIALMKGCGINFYADSQDFISLPGSQAYSPPEEINIPASPYLSSFLLLAGAVSGRATVVGDCDWQGKSWVFGEFGAGVSIGKREITVSTHELAGTNLMAPDVGDLLPHAMVLASVSSGETQISHLNAISRRHQERARKLSRELVKLGAKIREENDRLIITGGNLIGTKIDPGNDAAVAMACAAAGAHGTTVLDGVDCVERAYPSFFSDLASLGASVE
jgi:3-phosphoshikimate 1-carboxyvinyltransferase